MRCTDSDDAAGWLRLRDGMAESSVSGAPGDKQENHSDHEQPA